ncbi:11026_t:CDS:2 [Dentiscutata erythropus]|uniref:11026_t:CDS:1 n=1 Tax=Dentiscutata erythropus TaxID=1348616 RepID=A0A9N8WAA1_9GLOM|nr:11026_t:CDS:2 [Dentiscutata erythropus]
MKIQNLIEERKTKITVEKEKTLEAVSCEQNKEKPHKINKNSLCDVIITNEEINKNSLYEVIVIEEEDIIVINKDDIIVIKEEEFNKNFLHN